MVYLPTSEEKAKAKLFLNSRRDWTQWKGEHLLGSGCHSIIGLFSRNRMFKSKHFEREEQFAAVKQCDNYYEYVLRKQLPEEVMALTRLKPFKCNSIIKMIKWGPLPRLPEREQQDYRIYTEYCKYGSLGRLLYRHRRYGRYLVEPFLWNLFHHLAKALVVLEHGPMSRTLLEQPMDEGPDGDETSADENTSNLDQRFAESSVSHPPPGNDWKPIVHNDIKPQNIFLGDEDFDTFSFYPTAKLGDFGNAFLYTPEESQEAVMVGGTRTYQPPDDQKGPWSNIYGVGTCMFESATLKALLDSKITAFNKQKKNENAQVAGSQSSHSPRAEDADIFDWNCGGRTPCSRRLEMLILRCLEPDVNDRITAHELFLETRKALSEVRDWLKKDYGLDARPAIHSDGKKEPIVLPEFCSFKLSYRGSDIEGMPYGNYISDINNRPYLNDEYFPDLYTEGWAPMRFPMRKDFCCRLETEDLDHFRMPWETDNEWDERERDWPPLVEPDENGYDENGMDLFELEQPASDADGAGNEWKTDAEVKEAMKDEREEEEGAWKLEASHKKTEYTEAKKKATTKLCKTLREKLAEQAKRKAKDRGEWVSPPATPPAKRQKLTATVDEDDEGGEDDGEDGEDGEDEEDEGGEDEGDKGEEGDDEADDDHEEEEEDEADDDDDVDT